MYRIAALRHALSGFALVATCTLVAPPVAAQSAADIDAARELFKQASKAGKQGNWEGARDKFRRSLELKPAPITHFSLAIAEKNTGDYVEALENFRAFLVSPPDEAIEGYREPAQAAVEELEKLVGRVSVSVEPRDAPGLELTIDGAEVPPAALGTPRLVNPGEHVVAAKAKGYREARETVSVRRGGRAEVALRLTPGPADEASAPVGEGAVEDEGGSFPVGPVVLMSVGAAAIGAGLTVGILGYNEAKDAPASEGAEADAARTKGLVGDIVMGVGIASVVGGFIWLLVPSDSDEEAVAAGLEPWSSGDVAGVRLRF